MTPEQFCTAFDVSRETRARLETFVELLTRWNPRINLVSPGSLPDIWTRHLADSAQLLVLSESYHPGWSAQVDGAACAVVRVYGDFLGCRVGAGEHRVRFRFEPKSFRDGLRASAAGLVLAVAWAAWTAGYHRRRTIGGSER